MICEDIRIAFSDGDLCEETDSGARVITHCLYPSFEPVEVFVAKHGEGFLVSDRGGAANSAWLHGRDEIGKIILKECARFGVTHIGDAIEARVPSVDWLKSAVLGVANASASAAAISLEKVIAVSERALAEKIFEALSRAAPASNIAREFEYRGASGKKWRSDFGVTANDNLLLVNAVSPHPVSISAKYVAFADAHDAAEHTEKIAVYGSRRLETPDVSLITQVATLMPVTALERGARDALWRGSR